MNSRLFSLVRKEFIQIVRDPRTMGLIVLIPIIQLFLLGYSATSDVRNIPLAVFDQDRGPSRPWCREESGRGIGERRIPALYRLRLSGRFRHPRQRRGRAAEGLEHRRIVRFV